ncbi:MAG: FKBP-type peptidyl-prolyl cis-trans isomerase [Treponemataceae bacterium]
MKKLILTALAVSFLLVSCKAKAQEATKNDAKDSAVTKPASKKDVGYALGVAIGTSMKPTGIDFDYNAFLDGMKDALGKEKAKVSPEEANKTIQAALAQAMEKKAVASAAKEKDFFDKNGKKAGVKTTASGLQYEVITEGKGVKPIAANTVKVNYVGTLLDGKKFDSSIDRGEPAVFPLDKVIPGWTEGIQLMTVGSKYKLYIPSALAYGAEGAGGVIGPNETLTFEVELISIEKSESAPAPAGKK